MKKFITAAFLTTAATTAYANDITFTAGAEYSVEAETFEMNAGAAYNLYDFALFTEATFMKEVSEPVAFDNVEVGIAYGLNDNVDVYGLVRLDSDFEYDETVVGIAVTF
jgi:hypothetical protein